MQKAATSTFVGSSVLGVARVPKANAKGPTIYELSPNSLTSKVIVITGCSSGLGLESAKRLAVGGATIVMTTRTPEKGTRAMKEVKQYLENKSISNDDLYSLALDLDDLDSVRSFPQRYSKLLAGKKIDVLINNAGVAAIPNRELTKFGFERTFQSNHLGPFLLTAELFPYLNRNGSRIVNVSSNAHTFLSRGLDMGNLNGEREYSGWPIYAQTKLENILFTQELQRRADAAGLGGWFSTVSLHPGVVGTDIWRNSYIAADQSKFGKDPLQVIASRAFYGSVLSTEEGANTQVWLAAFGEDEGMVVKGKYFDENRHLFKLNKFAVDEKLAQLLWERSEELTGTKFQLTR